MDAVRELATFLRTRRERLDPVQVGLPTRSHRRTGGLRREEVAELAGLSVDYVTRLEQGRGVRPSPAGVGGPPKTPRLRRAEPAPPFQPPGPPLPPRRPAPPHPTG